MLRSFQERRLERIQRRIEELRAWRNARETPITDWTFTASDGVGRTLRLGDFWPVHEVPVQIDGSGHIPADWAGEPVELELWLGGEGFIRLSTGLQAGLNPMHHSFPVTESASGGETITIEAEVVPKGIFGSNLPEPRIERAHFVIPHREIRALERDLTMLLEACLQLGDHEVVAFLLDVAETALSELADGWPTDTDTSVSRYVLGYGNGLGSGVHAVPADWQSEAFDAARPTNPTWSLPPAPCDLEPITDEGRAAVVRARTVFADGLERVKQDYPPMGRLCLTGHAHIDLAWLWPLAETRRKIRRTFSTVLNLMDQYPDFTFNQSSAQAYAWIEEDDPAVFARIQERVAEGRWEPVGGMWLEPDSNVTGGESMVRHMLYGQRYFERAFGKRHSVAWLPDVFGFSGAMPQLLQGGGITGFFTIKVNWNEATKFPFDLFEWEGIDGTTVNAHTFFNPGHGYNGNIVPLDVLGTWRNYRGKTRHPESLLTFGWGDGAGGPSTKMLENYQRLKEFPAMPRLRMGLVEEYFADLPESDLPRYVGELYFELHRGTLTSQGRTKVLNRAAEHRLLEAEAFGTIASAQGFVYPHDELESAWKTVLLNQFHDILPGSSIHEVYIEAEAQLAEVVETATRLRDEALVHIGNGPGSNRMIVANSAILPRPLEILLPGKDASTTVKLSTGDQVATQETRDGLLVYAGQHLIPALGTTVIHLEPKPATPGPDYGHAKATAVGDSVVIENEIRRIEIGPDGTIARIFDKSYGREVLADRANQLWVYVDKPRAWEAWDVDETYERDGVELTSVEAITILEAGPLRTSVQVDRVFRSSRITQTYRLWSGSRRLDIETEIDWHERQVLLKARLPLNVHTHEATFETMFGVVRRPTHRNTAADAARFEGSGHRFADMSEAGYGVAILNNGRYGYGVHGNVMTLSLLRSPLYPDALADEGEHRFTYSILPHAGDWSEAGVAAEAFALNSPLIVQPAGADVTPSTSFAQVAGMEFGLGALKRAEDGNDTILRLYEPNGARGVATVRFGTPVSSAERVNLMEELVDGAPIELSQDGTSATIAIRPFEVLTMRLHYQR